jgi:hypothetical protein
MTDFLWSDAWILQAIAVAAETHLATLAEILRAADVVNHALPTDDEFHGALLRLTNAGFIEESAGGFALTSRVPRSVVQRLLVDSKAAAQFLDAEPWTSERNVRDPRNRVRYPGLTDERLRAADHEYRRRGHR